MRGLVLGAIRKETFAVSLRVEQLCLHTKQCVVVTVEESVLRTEMENFESQESLVSVTIYRP